ncbi:30S ribosomal protein [Dirofilaria immitis]
MIERLSDKKLEQELLFNLEHVSTQVRIVTTVTKGGRRFSFSILVVVGDEKGRVGCGMGDSCVINCTPSKRSDVRFARRYLSELTNILED